MSDKERQVCPWCQTEIIWDPDTGPEEECPYCFNELGDYRSVTFSVDRPSISAEADEEGDDDEVDPDMDADVDGDLDDGSYPDLYSERVQQIIDQQEEAPECGNCRELMMFGGTLRLAGDNFVPAKPLALGKELMPNIFEANLYVCPSCFKTETYLAEPGRLRLTQILGE